MTPKTNDPQAAMPSELSKLHSTQQPTTNETPKTKLESPRPQLFTNTPKSLVHTVAKCFDHCPVEPCVGTLEEYENNFSLRSVHRPLLSSRSPNMPVQVSACLPLARSLRKIMSNIIWKCERLEQRIASANYCITTAKINSTGLGLPNSFFSDDPSSASPKDVSKVESPQHCASRQTTLSTGSLVHENVWFPTRF